MLRKRVPYEYGGIKFEGYLAYEDNEHAKRPAVLVAHTWRGQDDFAREKAEALAKLGYIGFATDVYGAGIQAANDDQAAELMAPLFRARLDLRNRINAGLEVVAKLPFVDKDRMGAIGFCFGGLVVQELLFGGASVKGVVSFHGLMGNTLGELKANPAPQAKKIHGSILLLHGNEDPLVSSDDIRHLQKKLTDAQVDWQMNIYGNVAHAFTNPLANEPKLGMVYNASAESRAWKAMYNFFEEKFK